MGDKCFLRMIQEVMSSKILLLQLKFSKYDSACIYLQVRTAHNGIRWYFSILKVENDKMIFKVKNFIPAENLTFINKTIAKTVAQLSQYEKD